VPDHYRQHVAEKLSRIERYETRTISTDVELLHEKNPRQSEACQRVEITCRVRGPVVRVEACASDFYKALDIAADRLERKFRQAADRRRIHHGRRTPTSVANATSTLPTDVLAPPAGAARDAGTSADPGADDPFSFSHLGTDAFVGSFASSSSSGSGSSVPGGVTGAHANGDVVVGEAEMESGLVVRMKDHSAKPMTIDQALFEMELVEHDFYLFADSDTGNPSVVYKRKGYAYGVIRLVE
jgi:ribosomal subunit interface protein